MENLVVMTARIKMMNNRKIFSVIVLLLLFVSCNSNKKKDIDVSAIKIVGVSLDNTKLWQANLETTDGSKKMQRIMASFSEKENVTAYSSVKEELEAEFTNIFQKCTMKGEAHNQLHNYLKPMINIFEGLESSNINTCKTSYKTIENHLAGYANYFE